MTFITWTQEQFATSVAKHDEEHKHIFHLLNGLHDCLGTGDRRSIGVALDGLIAFVAHHFASEEQNMGAVGYHALGQHKREHEILVQTCLDLQKQFHDGRVDVTEETTGFLRDWLTRHIPQVDRMYGPALAAGGLN